MIIVTEGLHPTIACLHWETASKAFRGKQLVPVGLAVRQSILHEKGCISKQFAAMGAAKALRMEMFAHCIQAVALY